MARCKQLSCSRNDTPSPQTTETYRTPGQEPAGPHRELRCPPGTYFSPRSLRSNPSDLEENAVLDHKVRPRHRAQPHPRHLPASQGRTPLERAEQTARHIEKALSDSRAAAPGIRTRPLRGVLAVRSVRAASRTPTRPSRPPPPHMSAPPRTPPAKHRRRPPGRPPRSFPEAPQQPRTPKNPVSLEERRADIGQHPQAH